MDEWTYIQSIGGTAADTWRQGTHISSVIESQSAHSSTGDTSYTIDRSESARSSDVSETNYAASSFGSKYTGDTARSIQDFTNYAGTDSTGNNTLSTVIHELRNVTWRDVQDDTSASSGYSDSYNSTYNGTAGAVDTDTVTSYFETLTINGANSFISSFVDTIGSWTSTTILTDTASPFANSFFTTVSATFTVSSNSTQTKTSSSSWTISQGLTQNTTKISQTISTPITYAGDHVTVNASTVTWTGGSYTSPVTTETVTLHAYSQKINTVLLMHGNRGSDDYNLGDMLWSFSLSSIGESTSEVGRFTKFFGSANSATVTLVDFEKYKTNSIAVSEIPYSQNTATSTVSTITGTGTSTVSTGATVVVISKGGLAWNSSAASNTATDAYAFSIGSVGTLLSTSSYGSPATTFSETIFTNSVQITGYNSNFSWTTSTESQVFNSSSFSETRLALWNSTTTSMDIVLRSTALDNVLISSYSSYLSGTDTSHFFVGKVSTLTTRVYSFGTTTSRSLYASNHNKEVQNFTSFSTYSLPGGGNGETYSVSEDFNVTNFTKYRATPQIRTTPDGLDEYQFSGDVLANMNKARFSVLPNGYAGFGGNFQASSLPVNFTIGSTLVSGSEFAGQSIQFNALSTVSAYPNVTLFPVDANVSLDIPGAARAEYISGLSSIGTASIAVTWSSTTTDSNTSGTFTKIINRNATYALAGASPIAGTFFTEENLSIGSEESFQIVGGYAVGDNNLGNPYTVFAKSGFAQWTEYSPGQSIGTNTFSSSAGNGIVSFTVNGNNGIVFQIEPIFTANWTGEGEIPFYFSSTPYVKFE